MKRKLRLSAQIIIIYLAAFLLSGVLAGILIVYSLDDMYLNNIYSELESEGKALRLTERSDDSYEPKENTAYIRYCSEDNSYVASENIHDFIDDPAAVLLINKAAGQQQNSQRYKNKINSKLIYYVVLNYSGFFGVQRDDIIIVLTDTSIKNEMVADTALRLIGALLIAFAVGWILMFMWARGLLQSIKKISTGIIRMGEDHYKAGMDIKRSDEIGELAENIEYMRKKIVENELGKQTVIQGIGHDLKNPVGIIESYAVAIEDDMCEPMKAASIILKQSKRLSDRISKLLGMTRLGYLGMMAEAPGKTDMKVLLEEALCDYALLARAELLSDIEPAFFEGDPESWRIVVENLLENAARYAKSYISVSLHKDYLGISNDGKPIEEGYLNSIFKPYEKSNDGRFGLGLSIVEETAKMFGYRTYAENFEGGVRFVVVR